MPAAVDKPILAVAHVFYPELWNELQRCLLNMRPYPVDLYISITEENLELRKRIEQTFPNAIIMVVENKGYDIAPFVSVINRVDLDKYDLIVKIHSKRDIPFDITLNGYNLSGARWREAGTSFLQSPRCFKKCVKIFKQNKKLGMTADHRLILNNEPSDIRALKNLPQLLQKANLPRGAFAYAAGTMFMARAAAFKPLQQLNIKTGMFKKADPTHRTSDLAHTLERFMGCMILAQGMELKDIYTPCQNVYKLKRFTVALRRFFFRTKVTPKGIKKIKVFGLTVLRLSA